MYKNRRNLARLFVIFLTGVVLAWVSIAATESPATLYSEAQKAAPKRAVELYGELADNYPQIEEYARLWAAEAAMPSMDAIQDLQAVIDFRPQSPAAYQAHLILARYYMAQEAPVAEQSYRAAIALDDDPAIRLELARYLESQGDLSGAYEQYRLLLGERPDAFAGMRRIGTDTLVVAEDLGSAAYYTDVLETLRGMEEPEAWRLRARAFMGLGRYAEAVTAYESFLAVNPDDETAQFGLAQALAWLDRRDETLILLGKIDSADSRLMQAQLLEENFPDQALALYLESPYPTAWWSATALLEGQGRLTETLSIYTRVAEADIQYADDAAYRLTVLGRRLDDTDAQAKGRALLDKFGLNWLALQAGDAPLQLDVAPAIVPDETFLDKVRALELIGREDLARMELVLAARFRSRPEIDLAMALALAERGDVITAQQIAEKYAGDHRKVPLAFWRLNYPRPYAETVEAAAQEFGVDPLLIWSVMREESRFDPDALSWAGARGLMQVIPSTQAWIGEELDETLAPGDAYDPETSIRMGVWLLGFLLEYFDDDLELAVPAYNAGAASVESWLDDPRVENRDDYLRWIGYNETRLYLKRVLLSYEIYRLLYAED